MAIKSKIRFEWDFDRPGMLRAIRDKGKITYDELLEAINSYELDLQGYVFALSFVVDRERLAPVGWMDETEPEGDVWELWDVMDGEPCPICQQLVPPQYCPECGAFVFPLTEMGGKHEKQG